MTRLHKEITAYNEQQEIVLKKSLKIVKTIKKKEDERSYVKGCYNSYKRKSALNSHGIKPISGERSTLIQSVPNPAKHIHFIVII